MGLRFARIAGLALALALTARAEDSSNADSSVSIRERDGALSHLSANGVASPIAPAAPPIWSLELRSKGSDQPHLIAPTKSGKFHGEQNAQGGIRYTGEFIEPEVRVTVHASSERRYDFERLEWTATVEVLHREDRLWSFTFPQVAVAASDPEPANNKMVVPYRRGQLRAFGETAPKGEVALPYPGPSAKYQFLAAYGRGIRRGLYFAAEDAAGYSKDFIIRNEPQTNDVVFAVRHLPAGRAGEVRHFETPFTVVTAPFAGDWWDAARLYRAWWTEQKWAYRGLLSERTDLPAWLTQAPLAVRPSTTKPSRTVALNSAALHAIADALPGRPFFGVWYGCGDPGKAGESLDQSGYGHLLPPRAGLVEAVASARMQNIHLQAYQQSMIFDSSLADEDPAPPLAAVTRDEKGAPVPYGSGPAHLFAMCRATSWWQERQVALAKRAISEWGFSGVYLDSFGKGAPECFAANHGHPMGGGNTVIAGQRELVRQVREAARVANPEAILSGEDPVEAFRDLLDVNLYSVNLMKDYVPVTRTIWGDYSLGHGRVLTPAKEGNLFAEMAALFLEGTIPGRLYCDAGPPFLLQPEYQADLAALRTFASYTEHGIAYLRFGEYLHPLELSPTPPAVEFHESTEHQLVRLPGVLHCVTRSHADGSTAYVFVNITGDPQHVTVPLKPAARLARLSEVGERTWLQANGAYELNLAPREVAFLIVE